MNIRNLFVCLIIIFKPVSAGADLFGKPLKDGKWFHDNDLSNVEIFINDTSRDGCWSNLKVVREYTEEKLRNIGLNVLNLNDIPKNNEWLMLQISLSGGKNGAYCVIGASVSLYYFDSDNVGERQILNLINQRTAVITNTPEGVNTSMIDLVGLMFRDY